MATIFVSLSFVASSRALNIFVVRKKNREILKVFLTSAYVSVHGHFEGILPLGPVQGDQPDSRNPGFNSDTIKTPQHCANFIVNVKS